MRRRSGSLASLREGNRKRVIDALRERGVASRAEVARMTGLSRSTVSTIVGDLIESGLAGEREGQSDGESQAGRPPVMVSLNPSAGYAVGIDFGHRHLRVAVADLAHRVLAETWRELNVDHSAEHGLDTAAEFVEQVLDEAEVDHDRVIGVGMGLPAPIDRPPAPSRRPRSFPAGSASTPRPRPSDGSGSRFRSRTTPTWGRLRSSSRARPRAVRRSRTSRSRRGSAPG